MQRLLIVAVLLVPTVLYGQALDFNSFSLLHAVFYAPVVNGDYVYCAAHNFLLTISYADITHPELISQQYFDGGQRTGILRGNYIYFAGVGEAGLSIVDISDAPDPQILSNYNTHGDVYDLILNGDYAYIIGPNPGFDVINISDPTQPFISDSINTLNYPYAMAASGNYIYICDGDSGLAILNTSDAASPYLCCRYYPNVPWLPYLYDIAIREIYAYVLDYYGAMYILDISDPVSPITDNAFYPEHSLFSIDIRDTRLYGGSNSPAGIEVMDISDPEAPSHLRTYPIGNFPRNIAFSGDRLFYVWNRNSGAGVIQMIDLSDPFVAYMAGRFEAIDYPVRRIALSGNYAFVGSRGLSIMDVSNPRSPERIAEIGFGYVRDIDISDSMAYILDGEEFYVYDISTPQVPMPLGSCDVETVGDGLSVLGNFAFISGCSGIKVIDISNPMTPIVIAYYDTDHCCFECKAVGAYLYVVDLAGGLNIFSISDPAYPAFVSRLALGYGDFSWSLQVQNNYAYIAIYNLAGRPTGLKVVDVSNPLEPVIVSSIDTDHHGCSDVYVEGDYAYLVVPGTGLLVADISIPAAPAVVDTAKLIQTYGYLEVHNRTIYVANYNSFIIMEFTPGQETRIEAPQEMESGMSCFPNPSNSNINIQYELPIETQVELALYDINGRHVQTVLNEYQTAGNYKIAWNGNSLSSGTYFCRMKIGNYTESQKMLLLK